MSFAGSGYLAYIEQDQRKRKKEAKKKEQKKGTDKDRKKFLKKFGLM